MALDREKLRQFVLVTGAEEQPEDDGVLRYYRDFMNDILVLSDDLEDQYKRRALVKSAAAAFESSAFELWEQLKKIKSLSEDAKWVLHETNISLADNGEIKSKKAIYPLLTRFKFVFLQINEVLNREARFTVTNKFWILLKAYQETRNKLLHPNTKEIPVLSDEQIEELIALSGYIFTLIHICMLAVSWDIAKNNQTPSDPNWHMYNMNEIAKVYYYSFFYLKQNGILSESYTPEPTQASNG